MALVIALIVGLLPLMTSPADAASTNPCGLRACKSAIARCKQSCAQSTGRRRTRCRARCKSQTLKACRRDGVSCDETPSIDPNARGVFGSIGGLAFTAPALDEGKGTDTCVIGTLRQQSVPFGATIVAIVAQECGGTSQQTRTIADVHEVVSIDCFLPPAPLVAPAQGPCVALYARYATVTGLPMRWLSTHSLPASSVVMDLTAYDGIVVRGALSGVFDVPDDATQSPSAVTIESLRFHVPVTTFP